jgi:hypothetical protein
MDRAVPPFFLVGNPRSGTKMLRELLNASPDIWISDVESHFVPKFTRVIDRFGDLSDPANFQRLAAALTRTRAFWYRARRGVHVPVEEWYAACRTRNWPGVLEGLYRCVYAREIARPARRWDDVIWGDKTPEYMTEVPLLSTLFPHSRFVHIVRDPRDCCLSTERAWGNTPLRTAQEWADRTRRCRAAGRALGPTRYLEVRYEEVVVDVCAHVSRVFDFLGVPTPEDVGRLFRVPENLGAARGAAGVVATNTGKWKHTMPPALRRRIEHLTGDQLAELGYEREYPALQTTHLFMATMMLFRARDAWRQLRFRRKELGGWGKALQFLLLR